MIDFEAFAGKTALITPGGAVSYFELGQLASAFAGAAGGRALVLILCRNSLPALAGIVGALEHGAVPLLVDAGLNPELLGRLADLYRPDFIYRPAAGGAAPSGRVYELDGYELVRTPYAAAFPLHPELALLVTTSGSTGSPRLVRQSYANLADNYARIIGCLEIEESERTITTLPLNYTYGLSVVLTHLMAGASVVVSPDSLMSAGFWKALAEHRVTTLNGVPFTYQMLDRLRFASREWPGIRKMTQAGGHLSAALQERFARWCAERGKRFYVMYGQAEATTRMACLPPEECLRKIGSIGRALPGGELWIADGNGGRIRQPGARGELCYRGANVTLGYACRGEDLSLGDERRGVLRTGDLGCFDEDGCFYVTGRASRYVKLYGSRVSLDETEWLLRERFPGLECACAGLEDRLCVFTAGAAPGLKERIPACLSDLTGISRSAFSVRELPCLPRSAAGKILYSRLIEELSDEP